MGRPPGVSSPGLGLAQRFSRPPARILRLRVDGARSGPAVTAARRREREAAGAAEICSLRDPAGPRQRRNCELASRLGSGRVHALLRLLERVCPSSLLSPSRNRYSSLSISRGFSCSRVCKPPGFRRASSLCPLKIRALFHFL